MEKNNINTTDGATLLQTMKSKLGLDEMFLTSNFYAFYERNRDDVKLTNQRKKTLNEKLSDVYCEKSLFKNELREDLIQENRFEDPEIYTLGGFPCNRCNGTRKLYFDGLKENSNPNSRSNYDAGLRICTCIKIIDSLLDYKVSKDDLIETQRFFFFATHRGRYQGKGSIPEMIRNREAYPIYFNLLKSTVNDLIGIHYEKIDDLKKIAYPENPNGKPIIRIFKEALHLKFQKHMLDEATSNCYEEQKEYIEKYIEAKVRYVLDRKSEHPVPRPMVQRSMSYDASMLLQKHIGSTNQKFLSNKTANKLQTAERNENIDTK